MVAAVVGAAEDEAPGEDLGPRPSLIRQRRSQQEAPEVRRKRSVKSRPRSGPAVEVEVSEGLEGLVPCRRKRVKLCLASPRSLQRL